MVEPLSVVAGVVTTLILPKALEKVGEKIGEAAWKKVGKPSRRRVRQSNPSYKRQVQAGC